MSDSAAHFIISTCPVTVSKITPAIFPRWAFFVNPGGKSAVKLREELKSQLVFVMHQKLEETATKGKTPKKNNKSGKCREFYPKR